MNTRYGDRDRVRFTVQRNRYAYDSSRPADLLERLRQPAMILGLYLDFVITPVLIDNLPVTRFDSLLNLEIAESLDNPEARRAGAFTPRPADFPDLNHYNGGPTRRQTNSPSGL